MLDNLMELKEKISIVAITGIMVCFVFTGGMLQDFRRGINIEQTVDQRHK